MLGGDLLMLEGDLLMLGGDLLMLGGDLLSLFVTTGDLTAAPEVTTGFDTST